MLVNHMSTLKVITFKTNNIYCAERRALQLHLKIDKNESISIHGKLAREDSCTGLHHQRRLVVGMWIPSHRDDTGNSMK